MKKIIQIALSRFILLCTLTLIGLTSYAQFNYVPGTTYTFRTLVSSTQSVQIDVLYDANDNATVTLTSVAAQTGDKRASHIFLPTNNEYTFDPNTGIIEVNQNNSYYKVIDLINGTNSDFTVGKQKVPTCHGCKLGNGGCKVASFPTGNGHWDTYCDWDGGEKVCQTCNDMTWEEASGNVLINPILVIRISGNLIIQ